MAEYTMRMLTSIQELKQVQELERKIWQMDPVPLHQTITAARNGGILLGMFDGEKMVAFSYGFPGYMKGKTYLCSHMLGVDPCYQSRGLGEKLKRFQREKAIEMGYDCITWTYDPLESLNGYFNLHKLRAICSTYVENCYGEMEDALNQGLPSDRFKVEWWIQHSYVTNPACWGEEVLQEGQPLAGWRISAGGLPEMADFSYGEIAAKVEASPFSKWLVPIPVGFQEIKKKDHELACDWRLKARQIFQLMFHRGYAAVDAVRLPEQPVLYYVLVPRREIGVPWFPA